MFKQLFQEGKITPRTQGTNGRRSFARNGTLTLCVLHEDCSQRRRRLPACSRHEVLRSPTTVPRAFCLCVGVDCQRRRKLRLVRPRAGLTTALATVLCASGFCAGADCRRRRKRRAVHPRWGLTTAPATVLFASGFCAGVDCRRRWKRRSVRPRGDCRGHGPRLFVRPDSVLVCTA